MTTTNTRFTRRTLAIALAAGMSLGAVTVPQIAAVDGVAAVASAESGNVPPSTSLRLYLTPSTYLGIVRRVNDNKIVIENGAPGKTYTYDIPAETLTKAGIDLSREITIESVPDNVKVESRYPANNGGLRTDEHTVTGTTATIPAGKAKESIKLTKIDDKGFLNGGFVVIKQGDKELSVMQHSPGIKFYPLDDTVVKSGSQVKTKRKPDTDELDNEVQFSLVNDVPGVEVSPAGEVTYAPPADFAGGYVEIEVKVEIDLYSLGDTYVSGDSYTATATYRVYVEPQPQSDLHVTVKDNKDGTYTLSKNDGSKPVTIKTKDGVQSVSQSGNTITFTMSDGSKKTVKVTPESPVTITDNKNGTATISDGKTKVTVPTQDLRVTDVKKLANGDYEVIRSDGQKWTIKLADLLKRVSDLEGKDSPTRSEYDALVKDLQKAKDGIDGLKGKDAKIDAAIQELKNGLDGLDGRVSGLEGRVTAVENATIKQVIENADGTYTLVRVDGSKVPGNIDPRSGSVTNVTTDGKGNLVITIDGKDKTVPLEQVKVTESNKGKTNHTVTITTPDGKTVTFNVFDTYVTDVKKDGNGNYVVTRNDGKTWTINLSDLRKRIADLEAKDSPTREEYDKLVGDLQKAKDGIDGLKGKDAETDAAIKELKDGLRDLTVRVTNLEMRVTEVEDRTDALTKCMYGAGTVGIPALIGLPLLMLNTIRIPAIEQVNKDIQERLGIFNPDVARMWGQSGGVLQAGAVLAGLAGAIGGIAYLSKECAPLSKTEAAQDTDLGKLSSKLEAGSSKSGDAPAVDAGSSVDLPAATGSDN